MWISKTRYTDLIKAETRADWLLTRVNQLELELATERHARTGVPQPVPMIRKESTPEPEDPITDSFEDLGDELAKKYRVAWDDHGRVVTA